LKTLFQESNIPKVTAKKVLYQYALTTQSVKIFKRCDKDKNTKNFTSVIRIFVFYYTNHFQAIPNELGLVGIAQYQQSIKYHFSVTPVSLWYHVLCLSGIITILILAIFR
jgi:hypothetical protein